MAKKCTGYEFPGGGGSEAIKLAKFWVLRRWGLYYDQDLSVGELQAWQNDMVANMTTLSAMEFVRGSIFGATLGLDYGEEVHWLVKNFHPNTRLFETMIGIVDKME